MAEEHTTAQVWARALHRVYVKQDTSDIHIDFFDGLAMMSFVGTDLPYRAEAAAPSDMACSRSKRNVLDVRAVASLFIHPRVVLNQPEKVATLFMQFYWMWAHVVQRWLTKTDNAALHNDQFELFEFRMRSGERGVRILEQKLRALLPSSDRVEIQDEETLILSPAIRFPVARPLDEELMRRFVRSEVRSTMSTSTPCAVFRDNSQSTGLVPWSMFTGVRTDINKVAKRVLSRNVLAFDTSVYQVVLDNRVPHDPYVVTWIVQTKVTSMSGAPMITEVDKFAALLDTWVSTLIEQDASGIAALYVQVDREFSPQLWRAIQHRFPRAKTVGYSVEIHVSLDAERKRRRRTAILSLQQRPDMYKDVIGLIVRFLK